MEWGVVYYRAANGAVPAEAFLDSCPAKIEARILAVLEVVRAAPPPAFSGGGMWEAMHGSMNGYYEIRVTGPGRAQYRLFCLLDNAQTKKELARRGFDTPQIAVINGMSKPIGEVFSDSVYRKHVRDLGEDYRKQLPRRIAGWVLPPVVLGSADLLTCPEPCPQLGKSDLSEPDPTGRT